MCVICYVLCCCVVLGYRRVKKKKVLGMGKPSWSLEYMRVMWSV